MHTWPEPVCPQLPESSSAELPTALTMWDTSSGTMQTIGSHEGTARLYVCGITPYDATHLGHAFTYLIFDSIQRCWRDLGLDVVYVQNVTDVDDPLLERAEQTGQDWRDIAISQVDLFRTDMAALRILPPHHWIAATEALGLVEETINQLISTGQVYQLNDEYPDWYFSNISVDSFGNVAHLDAEQQYQEFAQKGGDPQRLGKHHPLDSLVWRIARPGEPSWDSACGVGRPGWHIECAAIAQKYLGNNFDVQGGGSDLAFPHHEMCAALGEATTGEPFAQHYIHVGMVGLDGQKMSKSLGNLELVSRLRLAGWSAATIRVALLNHHYREDWEWFACDIQQAEQRIKNWQDALAQPYAVPAQPVIDKMRFALRTDLNLPQAIAVVDEWAEQTNAGNGDDPPSTALMRQAIDALLGIALA